jgi:tetratricopeptide (TPR) repeat protein
VSVAVLASAAPAGVSAGPADRLSYPAPRMDAADTPNAPTDLPAAARPAYERGLALFREGRIGPAVEAFSAALRAAPRAAGVHAARGQARLVGGQVDEAIADLSRAAELAPERTDVRLQLGVALGNAGRVDEALAALDAVLAGAPRHADALLARAVVLEKAGRYDAGYEALSAALDEGASGYPAAFALALLGPRKGKGAEAVERIERTLAEGTLPPGQAESLHFEAGRILDRLERFDEAFAHYEAGNRLHPGAFDLDAFGAHVDRIIATFSRETLDRLPRARHGSEVPVFVVGMPRSGTTLTEQILAAHPEVHGAGESPALQKVVNLIPAMTGKAAPWPECAARLGQGGVDTLAGRYLSEVRRPAPDAARVTDKMPQNFLSLGLVALLFPSARVIHCVRDPVDTALSCYFQAFTQGHGYSFDLATLGAYYRHYRRLMDHWSAVLDISFMETRYEDMVADQEAMSRRLVDFVGLPWDEACLRFFESDRLAHTASYDQVRRPIYRRSVGRWRHYAPHLGPLFAALGDLAPEGLA